jgi:hypothetical protein
MLSKCQFLCGTEDSASSLTHYCEFATKLGIKDCEYYVPCFIVSDGDFGIDAHNLECFCDDIDSVINALIQEIGEK